MITMIEKLKCKNCGHRWYPKAERLPVVCPRCKSYDWNDEFEV